MTLCSFALGSPDNRHFDLRMAGTASSTSSFSGPPLTSLLGITHNNYPIDIHCHEESPCAALSYSSALTTQILILTLTVSCELVCTTNFENWASEPPVSTMEKIRPMDQKFHCRRVELAFCDHLNVAGGER